MQGSMAAPLILTNPRFRIAHGSSNAGSADVTPTSTAFSCRTLSQAPQTAVRDTSVPIAAISAAGRPIIQAQVSIGKMTRSIFDALCTLPIS